MKKYKQKELRHLWEIRAAINVTDAVSRKEIPEPYDKIGYAEGINGLNGLLIRGIHTDKLYVVFQRTQAIFIF